MKKALLHIPKKGIKFFPIFVHGLSSCVFILEANDYCCLYNDFNFFCKKKITINFFVKIANISVKNV